MFTLFVGLVVVALWVRSLAQRLTSTQIHLREVEEVAKEARAKSDLIARLTARVSALEAAVAHFHQEPGAAAPAPVPTPNVPPTVAPAQPIAMSPPEPLVKAATIAPAAVASSPVSIPRAEPVAAPVP